MPLPFSTRHGIISHCRFSKRSLQSLMSKWFKTVLVRIWTAVSPQVLLHGLHALHSEYWHSGFDTVELSCDVIKGAATGQFTKHRSSRVNLFGHAWPPFWEYFCQKRNKDNSISITATHECVIKSYNNGSRFPSMSIAARNVAWRTLPIRYLTIYFFIKFRFCRIDKWIRL